MTFNDLSISKKLMVAFAGVVTIVLVMSVAIYMALGSIRSATAASFVPSTPSTRMAFSPG